jgi:hypothetical protein
MFAAERSLAKKVIRISVSTSGLMVVDAMSARGAICMEMRMRLMQYGRLLRRQRKSGGRRKD